MAKTYFSNIPGPIPFVARIPAHLAATATEEWPVFRAPFACTLKKLDIVPQAAVTGDNTNRTNLNIVNKGNAGSGTTEVANLDLATGTNLTAFDSTNIPLNTTYASGVTLAEGDVVTIQQEKIGTGVNVPECLVYLEINPA